MTRLIGKMITVLRFVSKSSADYAFVRNGDVNRRVSSIDSRKRSSTQGREVSVRGSCYSS